MKRIKTVEDIVRWRLCVGCGACSYVCPEQAIELVDVVNEGVRPRVRAVDCQDCPAPCLQVCPSHLSDFSESGQAPGLIQELSALWGPVLEIWEGHATDQEIRYRGASGGVLTALSLYCLEREGMAGVLHIGQDPDNALRNRTRLSRSRSQLLENTGSRYAPASACDSLLEIESAPRPCVFIGQPSEVVALRKAQRLRPGLNAKVGLAMSFFCAGSPSTRGTSELLEKLQVDAPGIETLRYRGNGWPGHFALTSRGDSSPVEKLTYKESWSFLQAYRPYSTHVWPDGTGEQADLSCGDPWYRKIEDGEAGESLVVVRTEQGRRILREAMNAGHVNLVPADSRKLLDSQINLANKKRTVWGRQFAFRLFGLPVTCFKGVPLFRLWCELPVREKLRSVIGTMRRIVQRRYNRPLSLEALEVG